MFTVNVWGILWNLFLATWYLWLLLIILAAIPELLQIYIKKKGNEKRFNEGKEWHEDKNLIYWLRGMKPGEFEDYIAGLYSHLGYKTEKVGRTHDGGVDVKASKDGILHYIQCKKFITRKVGVDDMRIFAGALVGKLANSNGIFITTNIFTTEARKFAENNRIELIDGDDLARLVKSTGIEVGIIKKDENIKCPRCGGDLVKRKRKKEIEGSHGEFYGCSNYPKCTFTQNI